MHMDRFVLDAPQQGSTMHVAQQFGKPQQVGRTSRLATTFSGLSAQSCEDVVNEVVTPLPKFNSALISQGGYGPEKAHQQQQQQQGEKQQQLLQQLESLGALLLQQLGVLEVLGEIVMTTLPQFESVDEEPQRMKTPKSKLQKDETPHPRDAMQPGSTTTVRVASAGLSAQSCCAGVVNSLPKFNIALISPRGYGTEKAQQQQQQEGEEEQQQLLQQLEALGAQSFEDVVKTAVTMLPQFESVDESPRLMTPKPKLQKDEMQQGSMASVMQLGMPQQEEKQPHLKEGRTPSFATTLRVASAGLSAWSCEDVVNEVMTSLPKFNSALSSQGGDGTEKAHQQPHQQGEERQQLLQQLEALGAQSFEYVVKKAVTMLPQFESVDESPRLKTPKPKMQKDETPHPRDAMQPGIPHAQQLGMPQQEEQQWKFKMIQGKWTRS